MPDHSVTELYIEHYPLAKQMEYNSLLLDIKSNVEQKKAKILNYLSSLNLEELEDIMRDRQNRMKAALTFRDRNCTFSLTLDKRANKKSNDTFPLSIRFTIDRRSYYHHIGTDYSVEAYEPIRDAKDDSEYMEERKHWDELMSQYENLLRGISPGHALTLDSIKNKVQSAND